jgi:hypothetical protein
MQIKNQPPRKSIGPANQVSISSFVRQQGRLITSPSFFTGS